MHPPPGHHRLRLDLCYCGTGYTGWQAQNSGDAVQNALHDALLRLTKLPLSTEAASRTDAGVHALNQVAHVDVPDTVRLPPTAFLDGLNALLPESIRVLKVAPCSVPFNATLSAIGKGYRYCIWRPREMDAFQAGRAWHIHGPLDLDALQTCCNALVGTHNFVRFSANPGEVSDEARRADLPGHTRTLTRVDFEETDDVLSLEFEGNAFLYHMVRLMTGALLQVARRRLSVGEFTQLLTSPSAPQAQVMAPAGGLYLVRVLYPEATEPFDT